MRRFIVGLLPLVIALGCNIKKASSESQVAAAGGTSNAAAGATPTSAVVTVEELQDFIAKVIKEDPNSVTELYSFEGHCAGVSANWIERFKAKSSFQPLQAETKGLTYFNFDGAKVQRATTHFFLVFNQGTDNEIIFDPTYGQFVQGAENISDLPRMLLKPLSEVKGVYAKHVASLRLVTSGDEYVGKYNSDEFVEFLYSFGRFAKNRSHYGPF